MSERLWKHPRVRRQLSWNYKQSLLYGLLWTAPMVLWFILLYTFTDSFEGLFNSIIDRSVLLAALFFMWPQLLSMALPLALSWRHLARRRGMSRGLCWSCGYDLRQQPALGRGHLFIRCPECGKKSMTKKPHRRAVLFLTVCPPGREWTTLPRGR